METRIGFGEQQRHVLLLKSEAEGSAVRLEVDGTPVAQAPLAEDGDRFVCWFSTDLPEARRVLATFAYQSHAIENVKVWVDPTNERLRELGYKHLAGCEHLCERQGDWFVLPWRNFTRDLGAFVGSGFRFGLSNLVSLVVLYALAMTLTIPKIGHRVQYLSQYMSKPYDPAAMQWEYLSYCAVTWLLCLALFTAAGVGFCLRNPHSTPERKGWVQLRRMAYGLALGACICFGGIIG